MSKHFCLCDRGLWRKQEIKSAGASVKEVKLHMRLSEGSTNLTHAHHIFVLTRWEWAESPVETEWVRNVCRVLSHKFSTLQMQMATQLLCIRVVVLCLAWRDMGGFFYNALQHLLNQTVVQHRCGGWANRELFLSSQTVSGLKDYRHTNKCTDVLSVPPWPLIIKYLDTNISW